MITFKEYLNEIAIKGKAVKIPKNMNYAMDRIEELIKEDNYKNPTLNSYNIFKEIYKKNFEQFKKLKVLKSVLIFVEPIYQDLQDWLIYQNKG